MEIPGQISAEINTGDISCEGSRSQRRQTGKARLFPDNARAWVVATPRRGSSKRRSARTAFRRNPRTGDCVEVAANVHSWNAYRGLTDPLFELLASKNGPKTVFKLFILFGFFGAGEEIRTFDPNLGKIWATFGGRFLVTMW